MSFAPETDNLAKPETLIRVPVGLASPLWGLFAGAAMTGATWWWLTRWTRPENLEAAFGAAAKAETAAQARLKALSAPVIEATDAAVEEVRTFAEAAPDAIAEAVIEPVVEAEAAAVAVAEPVAEALVEAAEVPVPVLDASTEAEPISSALEALADEPAQIAAAAEAPAEVAPPTPKVKKKKAAASKAD